MSSAVPARHLLEELEPVVAQNLDRHLAIAQEWHPHDSVPGFGSVGERAREELGTFLDALDARATSFVDRRAEQRARDQARSDDPRVIAS